MDTDKYLQLAPLAVAITREALTLTIGREAFVTNACRQANLPEEEVWQRLHAQEKLKPQRPTTNDTDRPPQVAHHYQLGKFLGKGSQGAVYLAFDTVTGTKAAIKILDNIPGTTEPMKLPEIEALHALDDHRIVRLVDDNHVWAQDPENIGDPDRGVFYVATEYIEGGSLEDRLLAFQDKPLSANESAHIIRDVAAAVQHAHSRGFVHRDIKPANILLTLSGKAMLTDFGVAKSLATDNKSVPTADVGTLPYMAPEQLGRSHVAEAADIYAIGVLLYQCLAGQLPYSGTRSQTIDQIRHKRPKSPRHFTAGCPRDLEVICMRCLRKMPSLRPRTAQAICNDLESYLSNTPILIRPLGPTKRFSEWCCIQPVLATAGGLALLFFASLMIGMPLLYWSNLTIRARDSEKAQLTDDLKESIHQAKRSRLAASILEYENATNGLHATIRYPTDSLAKYKLEKSKEALDELRRRNPTSESPDEIQINMIAADVAILDKEFERARTLVDDPMTIERAESAGYGAQIHETLGDALDAVGTQASWERAQRAYERALTFDDTHPDLRLKIALCQFKLGQVYAAAETLTRVIESPTTDKLYSLPFAYYARGIVFGIRAKFLDSYCDYANAAALLKRGDPVLRDYIYMNALVACNSSALILNDPEKVSKSKEDLQIAVYRFRDQHRPEDAVLVASGMLSLTTIQLISEQEKTIKEAIQVLRDGNADPADPIWAEVQVERGLCLRKTVNGVPAAKEAFKVAKSLMPSSDKNLGLFDLLSSAQVRILLGDCYLLTNDFDLATAEYDSASPFIERSELFLKRKDVYAWFDMMRGRATAAYAKALRLAVLVPDSSLLEFQQAVNINSAVISEVDSYYRFGDLQNVSWLIEALSSRCHALMGIDSRAALADANRISEIALKHPKLTEQYLQLRPLVGLAHSFVAQSLAGGTATGISKNAAEIEKHARIAISLLGDQDDMCVLLLASALCTQGRLDEAIEWQAKAVQNAKNTANEKSRVDVLRFLQEQKKTRIPLFFPIWVRPFIGIL